MGYRKWLAILVNVVMILALFPAVGMADNNNNNDDCGFLDVRLLAGQDIDVGSVTVTNDDEKICVTYKLDQWAIDEGWEITKTHLYIGKNVPPTSAPGQLPYDDDDAVYDDGEVTYCIPLAEVYAYKMALNSQGRPTGVMIVDGSVTPGVEHCNDVFIAAHAVIEKCDKVSDTFEPELTWTRNDEPDGGIVVSGLGGTWDPADGFAIPTLNEFVWDGGEVGQYFTGYSTRSDINWASWVCTLSTGRSWVGTDLRRFNAAFDIPAGYVVTGGTLSSVNEGFEGIIPINDNIYIFVNQELLFWGGTLSKFAETPTHFEGMERRAVEDQNKSFIPETDGWYMLGDLPAIPDDLFTVGPNNLDVFAEEFWTGGGMHELKLDLDVCITTCKDETAWGEGTNFGTNWAMYFTHHICIPEPCVPASVIYGITGTGGTGGLWEIEFTDTGIVETLLINYDVYGDTYSGNGLAFDEENNRLYFAVVKPGNVSDLYLYDFKGNITLAAAEIPGTVYGATWYDGKYWYIPNTSDDMITVDFDGDGLNGSATVFEADFAGKSFRFGDIAWDDEDEVIYVSTSFAGTDQEFFKYDPKADAGDRYTLITSDATGKAIGLQLGFGEDGVLYGHNTFGQNPSGGVDAMEWFEVNKTGTAVSLDIGEYAYNDLASGPSVCD